MTGDLQIGFLVMALVTMGCVCHGCARVDMEKQAISRGYAIYDNNGVFQWKEQRND